MQAAGLADVFSHHNTLGNFPSNRPLGQIRLTPLAINLAQSPGPTMTRLLVIGCLSLVTLVNCIPLPSNYSAILQQDENFNSEDGNYFEGDIILLPEQEEFIKANQQGLKTLIRDPTAIWPDKTVYYKFAPNEFSFAQQSAVLQALNDIMSVSCVRFVLQTTEPVYIVLRNNARGCAAAVGYHNLGPLDLFLGGPTCQTRGTIQHEFLHTLGFWHEHTRQDRDQHVTINWENISRGKEFNFYKRDPSEIMNLNMPYDYGSVMHYRSIAFSKDLLSTTITPKVPSAAYMMGQRIRFSDVDLAKLNRLYECPPGYYRGDDLVGKAATVGDIGIPPRLGLVEIGLIRPRFVNYEHIHQFIFPLIKTSPFENAVSTS